MVKALTYGKETREVRKGLWQDLQPCILNPVSR